MRTNLVIIFLFLCSCKTIAQVSFKTIVPDQPIIRGESFRVQFIIEGNEKTTGFKAPLFTGFRLVDGPAIYKGSASALARIKPVMNMVFTLEALQPGKFIIPGATLEENGKLIRSNDAVVEIITRDEALKRLKKEMSQSAYFLKPGENATEKIKKNLFLKLAVNKKSCYVGEPILATFKLFSRLESKSDIIKNPGFYGFSVYDMINLSDKLVTVENINGKQFDVHTVRKVQLFPLQAGTFTIDPVEVINKVEFSRSAVFRKTEQEIVEGVLGKEKESSADNNTEVFETNMRTEPVEINVKPLPVNKPSSFTGAVGNFTMSTFLSEDTVNRNQDGFLHITINGKGNFVQLTSPLVKWPDGIEGFEPVITDSLNRSAFPVMGGRTFKYPFISSKPGAYIIPPVEFAFFNPDTNQYNIITTKEERITINEGMKTASVVAFQKKIATSSRMPGWLILSLAFTGIAGIMVLFLRIVKIRKNQKLQAVKEEIPKKIISIEELLLPAGIYMQVDDKSFYSSLYNAIWTFFSAHLNLSGSEMSKENLIFTLRGKNIAGDLIEAIGNVLTECEKGRFTEASLPNNKKIVLEHTQKLLERIEAGLL